MRQRQWPQPNCPHSQERADPDAYTDITELTPELLRLFIERIVVHEKEVKWSKHAPQTVEIYYNGIGYVGSGQQDVEEALEAPEPQQTQDTEKPRQAS